MTQINKELLEKYELGQCTDHERRLVLDWLDNDDWDALDTKIVQEQIPAQEGERLWENLETFIQQKGKKKINMPLKAVLSIAATVIFFLLGYALLHPYWTKQELSNMQLSNIEQVTLPFTLVLGKDSQAHIDVHTGYLTLSGEVLFTPNEDLILQHGNQSNLVFKAGETYYLSESKDRERIIIVKKDDITFLPAIVQKQLRKQFQIS